MYYIYMLRCEDNSIYTGITTDIKRRMEEHFSKGKKCAKYTLTHTPKKLETCFTAESRSTASQLEYRIKELTKDKKEKLIKARGNKLINQFFEEKIENLEEIKKIKI